MTAEPGAVSRQTVLHDRHLRLGARSADFGGWEMPIEYAGGGVVREHRAVRELVGLFDVSHLGKLAVQGSGAAALIDASLTNDLTRISAGAAQYSLCCNESGGVVDDLIVYLRSPDDVLLVPNAANSARVADLLTAAAPAAVVIRDLHDDVGVLAVQGPRAEDVLAAVGLPVGLDYLTFVDVEWREATVTVCRTGYTGERGYELLVPALACPALWDTLLDEVVRIGGLPCGLGARDTLRTEMGYPLHGHELTPSISPVQARLGWAVGWRKPTFWGRAALLDERERGAARTAWGLLALERGIPRPDLAITSPAGTPIGRTTSGTFSPTVGRGIALALLDRGVSVGDEVVVDVRGRPLKARVVKPPFVEARPRA